MVHVNSVQVQVVVHLAVMLYRFFWEENLFLQGQVFLFIGVGNKTV